MIKLKPKPVKDAPEEMTIKRSDIKIIKYLPACPKCSMVEDVHIFHVTQKIYECSKCNLRFHIV